MDADERTSTITTLSFALPGALIDRDRGLAEWYRGWLRQQGRRMDEARILASFDAAEQRLRAAHPQTAFTALLPHVHDALALEWGIDSDQSAALDLLDAIRAWPAYPDALRGWRRLRERYHVVAISGTDRWALEQMSHTLGDPFERLLPAEELGAQPPEAAFWRGLLDQLQATPAQVLHCAADWPELAGAARAGLVTAWLDRRTQAGGTASAGSGMAPDLHVQRLDELTAALQSPAA